MEKVLRKIQMVDLTGQYEKIKPEVDQALGRVIASAAFINGPEVKAFQSELEYYLGGIHVIPCANGTDALQVAMMALGLQPGDEVITADFTYAATAEVIALLKLTPVLVDVNPGTFTISPGAIEKAITPNTKAIVPVHLFGQCADMEEIMNIARRHNLYVIEDTAQAIGADYIFAGGQRQKAGTIGTIGCTSFFPSKNLGCFGDGGALFTRDAGLAGKIKMICNHGQAVQYYHDEIGVNSRLDSLQAAVLRVKLKHLDEYAGARNRAADCYDKAFSGHPEIIKIPVRNPQSTHVFHQYTLQIQDNRRDGLRDYLKSMEIPSMIYYPVPLHLQKAYQNKRYKQGDFPVTENLCSSVLSLPMHTELDGNTLEYITSSVLKYFTH